jgi:hemoglobin
MAPVLFAAMLAAGGATAQPAAERTLYERLGGLDGVATMADQLVDRMAADETLQANPYVHEAMTRVARAGLKYRLTTMLCASFGGPQTYPGRSLRDAHAHLRITGREWRAFMARLAETLDSLAIVAPAREEILALVEPAANAVVSAGELDGRSFTGERVSAGQAAGVPDQLSFAGGRLALRSDTSGVVSACLYAASVTDRTTTFEAERIGPDGETVLWKGSVKGSSIEATITVSKTGGPVRKSSFTGSDKP